MQPMLNTVFDCRRIFTDIDNKQLEFEWAEVSDINEEELDGLAYVGYVYTDRDGNQWNITTTIDFDFIGNVNDETTAYVLPKRIYPFPNTLEDKHFDSNNLPYLHLATRRAGTTKWYIHEYTSEDELLDMAEKCMDSNNIAYNIDPSTITETQKEWSNA